MSFTTTFATAACTVANLGTAKEAATSVADYLTNHDEEIPKPLGDLEYDEVVDSIASYLGVDGDNLTIFYDSEGYGGNTSSDVFDFLSSHYARLQSSPYMTVQWCCFDSRTGTEFGIDYYDNANSRIDVNAAIILWLNS